ncbi:MAG: hypothetical protein ACI9TH_004095 [Kiritimatiellia bacterium]|jgi:uncharacterized protein (DUF58 family)
MSTSQITRLMSNETLARVERLRINSSRRFTNKSRGEHLAGKGGQSIEFSDYRDYCDGDDVRYIDWNIFSRLRRPYMKIYHEEEEQHVVILIDGSSSMQFEGKFERAKELAAAFGTMGLMALERVSCWAFNDGTGPLPRFRPTTGRTQMNKLFSFVEGVEAGGDTPVDRGIETLLKYHRGRGVAIVISDFLTPADIGRTFNLLYSSGMEVMALQILGPTEIDPDVTGDVRFVDCETSTRLDVSSAASLLDLYQEYRLAFEANLEGACRKRGGQFISTNSGDSLEHVLFDQLLRKGWIK